MFRKPTIKRPFHNLYKINIGGSILRTLFNVGYLLLMEDNIFTPEERLSVVK